MPARLIVEMVYTSVFWLNCFPTHNGVSDSLSPCSIVSGQCINYLKHCRLEFGTYVQVHEAHDNSMVSRTTGTIALRPTGNAQGGYYFMSLTTGCCLNRNHWTSLPMPQDVINRVHTLARRQGAAASLLFADHHGIAPADDDPDYDDDDDSSYAPSDQGSDDSSASDPDADPNLVTDPTDIAGVDDDEDEELDEEPNDDNDGYIEIP